MGFALFTGFPLGSAMQARWSHLLVIGSHAEHALSESSMDPKTSSMGVDAVLILRTRVTTTGQGDFDPGSIPRVIPHV